MTLLCLGSASRSESSVHLSALLCAFVERLRKVASHQKKQNKTPRYRTRKASNTPGKDFDETDIAEILDCKIHVWLGIVQNNQDNTNRQACSGTKTSETEEKHLVRVSARRRAYLCQS